MDKGFSRIFVERRRVRFHVQLACDAEAGEEYVAVDPYTGPLNGHQRSEATHTLSQGSAPC
jgi:hypothetical protein